MRLPICAARRSRITRIADVSGIIEREVRELVSRVNRLEQESREARKENSALEKRVEALEREVQELNLGLNLRPVRAWDRAPTAP